MANSNAKKVPALIGIDLIKQGEYPLNSDLNPFFLMASLKDYIIPLYIGLFRLSDWYRVLIVSIGKQINQNAKPLKAPAKIILGVTAMLGY